MANNTDGNNLSADDILEYAKALMVRVRLMFSYLNIYKSLINNTVEYHDVMVQTPLFFNITESALVSALMIDLCKLFEESSQVMSLKKIYNICEQNRKSFPQMRMQDGEYTDIPCDIESILKITKRNFEKYSNVISNIKLQRDHLWAHTDKKYIFNYNELETNNPIEWEEIENLLKFANDFLNSIILCFTNGLIAPFFNSPTACEEETKKILSSISNNEVKEDKNNGKNENGVS